MRLSIVKSEQATAFEELVKIVPAAGHTSPTTRTLRSRGTVVIAARIATRTPQGCKETAAHSTSGCTAISVSSALTSAPTTGSTRSVFRLRN